MVMDKTKIGLVNVTHWVAAATQQQALATAGAQWIIRIGGKDGVRWEKIIPELSAEHVVYVYDLALVPVKRAGRPYAAQVARFMASVHGAGAHVVEVGTGRVSRHRAQRDAMIDDAIRNLRRSGKPLAAKKDPWRPRHEWASKEQEAEARRVWRSPHYTTRDAAIAHLPEGATPALIKRLGPRGNHAKQARKWKR